MPKWHAQGAQQLLLEACAAADSSLQPMGAFIQVSACDAAGAPWTAFNDITAFAVHCTCQVCSVESDRSFTCWCAPGGCDARSCNAAADDGRAGTLQRRGATGGMPAGQHTDPSKAAALIMTWHVLNLLVTVVDLAHEDGALRYVISTCGKAASARSAMMNLHMRQRHQTGGEGTTQYSAVPCPLALRQHRLDTPLEKDPKECGLSKPSET